MVSMPFLYSLHNCIHNCIHVVAADELDLKQDPDLPRWLTTL